MIRLALLLVLTLAGSAAQAQGTRACDKVLGFAVVAATGPTEHVVGKPNQRVYPCGFFVSQKGQSLDFAMWFAAPGTNCAGDQQPVLPQISLPSDVAIVNRTESVTYSSPMGYSLCSQTFGSTGGLTGAIYFAQF